MTGAIERGLRHLDALLFPSRHALEEHRRRGLGAIVPLVHLPYFLPDGWSRGIEDEEPEPRDRPYLAAAGRLVKMKGFQRLIPLMRYLPEVDLRIAGTGPYEAELRALAADLPNVHFEGLLGGAGAGPAVPRRPGGRGAVAVPRDVRLRRARGLRGADAGRSSTKAAGRLRETGVASGGGLGYRTDGELFRPAPDRPRRRASATSWPPADSAGGWANGPRASISTVT